VEESQLDRGQMVDHSVYVQVWSEGNETWLEGMVFAGRLSLVSDEKEDVQCFGLCPCPLISYHFNSNQP